MRAERLGAMLERRFESYKAHVVKPFFRDHFARLDRQIVLIDVLSAINAGTPALADLQRALQAILKCFRPGPSTWLSSILPRRIDRLLFAATKADHLHHTSHDRLEAILRLIADKSIARAEFSGAEVRVVALAALRSTREAEARSGWQRLPCIVGVPLPGERLGNKVFGWRHRGGSVPRRPAGRPGRPRAASHGPTTFISSAFARRGSSSMAPSPDQVSLPHIRLDRAMDFLLGDKLA